MAIQKIFTDGYASTLTNKVSRGEELSLYLNKEFVFDESETGWVGGLVQPEGLLDKMMDLSDKSTAPSRSLRKAFLDLFGPCRPLPLYAQEVLE